MLQNQLLQPDGGFLTRCNIADDRVLWHELNCAHSIFSALWSHLFSRDSYKIFNCMNFPLCKAAPRWCSAFIICHAWWIVLQASTESFTECTKRRTSRVLLTFSCPCWRQERHPDSEWWFFFGSSCCIGMRKCRYFKVTTSHKCEENCSVKIVPSEFLLCCVCFGYWCGHLVRLDTAL